MKTQVSIITLLITLAVSAVQVSAEQASSKSVVPSKSQQESDEKVVIDRSKRTSPRPATPSYAVGGANEASRYRTDQGWSRGRNYWWGSRHSDIPTTGYNRSGSGR